MAHVVVSDYFRKNQSPAQRTDEFSMKGMGCFDLFCHKYIKLDIVLESKITFNFHKRMMRI